ncbi:hypothetical protein AAG570_009471 [Ranatra chinensis]|uniref:Major facilitator superfamily (MFS) profile domain-containing protein n=1 Tax=Ranatra chinensis TaxID=642074 RepID=A0ABD0YP64_9HEMI
MFQKSGWTWRLVLAGVSTTVGASIPVGYNIGVVNAPSNIIKAWCNQSFINNHGEHISDAKMDVIWSSIVSVFLVGGMIGSLGGSWLADKVGRKGALMASSVIAILAALSFIGTLPLNSVELMFIGRILVGLSSGLVTAVMPMYLTELSPANLRGAMGVMCPLGVTFGVLLGQIMGLPFILGTDDTWHYLLALYGIPVLIGALAMPWLPESPKYLFAIKGLRQKAVKELSKIRNMPEDWVTGELEEKNETSDELWSVWRLLKTPSLLLNLALVCSLQAGQQFSGINAVFYYSISIFETAGLSPTNAQYGNLGAGVVNFLIAVIIIPVVNYCRRRTLAVTSCLLSTIALVALTIFITFMESFKWMSYLSIVAVLLFVLVYGTGLGPIPYFIGSELFSVGPRPAAMALGSVSNWGGNFIVGMTFPTIQRYIGAYSFLLFALSTILLTVFLQLCLPETNPKILALNEGSLPSDTTVVLEDNNAKNSSGNEKVTVS